MSITGRIHSFESFGTLDGPGIRFVVFLQGCPFRCLYCHNRDTWDPLGGSLYTVDEVFAKVSRFIHYFKASGGGITLSGGEPTLQPEFAAALFKQCRESGIHTVLDTNGHADIELLDELLPFTNLVLLDLKQANREKHISLTGHDPEKVLAFAGHVSQKNIPVWIRYVLVPGFTDADADLEAAARWIAGMHNIKKVEVLPYHEMGVYKWEELGLPYPLKGISQPSAESLEKARQILVPQRLRP